MWLPGMIEEKRDNPRIEAKGLLAKIMVTEPNRSVLIADVNLLNISKSGIKIRVQKPLIIALGTNIQLEVILPESGVPVIVNTVAVREQFDTEFGLHYIDLRPEDPIEKLMSECGHRTSWVD